MRAAADAFRRSRPLNVILRERFRHLGHYSALGPEAGNQPRVKVLTQESKPGDPATPVPESPMMEQTESSERPRKDVPLDEARLRQQAIGVKLRQMFDEVVSEPVPDDFLDILRRADDRRSGK